jgi:hypothetical protein
VSQVSKDGFIPPVILKPGKNARLLWVRFTWWCKRMGRTPGAHWASQNLQ